MTKNGWKTAEELMAELKSDPEYLARSVSVDNARQKLWDEWAKAEIPLVKAIRAKGVDVQSVWDLVNRPPRAYAGAIPVLVEHVAHDYPERILEGILRALATPDALSHWSMLVGAFERNTINLPTSIRYVAAVALNGAADDSVIDDVLRLVKNQSLGFDRAPLLSALKRSKDPRAKMLLLELRYDPELGPEVKKVRRLERSSRKNKT